MKRVQAMAGRAQATVLRDGTLMLFGVIGDPMDGPTDAAVQDALSQISDQDELSVLINSPGGDVAQGLAIYNALATHPGKVTVDIVGVAASMASAIAMAGDRVRIAKNGHVMIHDPFMVEGGNAEDLRKAADMLDRFGTSLARMYAERTKLPEDEVKQLMTAETWFTAEEALAKGFVDEIIEPAEASAFSSLDVRGMKNVPVSLVKLIKEGRKMARTPSRATPAANEPAQPAAPAARQAAATTGVDVQRAISEGTAAAFAAERQRASAIRALGTKFGRPEAWATQQIEAGATLEQARAALLDSLATGQGGPSFVPSGVRITEDARDKWREGMTAWLLIKSGQRRLVEAHTKTKLVPGEFGGLRLIDIARDAIERVGVSTRGKSPMDIAKLALWGGTVRAADAGLNTTSDFPVLLENVLHKLLMAAYATAEDKWRQVAAVGSVQDFRAHPRLRLGSMSRLDKMLESGEFKQLQFPDAKKETIKADTYGNLVGLTRQAIVNDDVDGFARLTTMLGRAAARSIEIDLFALLALNGGLGPVMNDGQTLFHATHNNIAATPAAPATASLEAARVQMAQQLDPDGNDYLDLRPDVWVGPIGLGGAVRVAINSEFEVPAAAPKHHTIPNIVRDLLSAIVDTPRLAGTRWYTFADPAAAAALEVVFLQGEESPVIEAQEGFDYDGIRWKVRHDYGVGATDWRPAVTNAGA